MNFLKLVSSFSQLSSAVLFSPLSLCIPGSLWLYVSIFLLDKCIFESETPLLAWNKAYILSLSCQLQPSLPTLSIFQSSYYFSSLPLQIPPFPWSFAYICHSSNTRDSLLCLIQHFKCFDWGTVFILLSKKIFISVNKITFLYNFKQLSSY